MTEKTRDAIRSALFEAAFVVLGVILALAANEWRQGRVDRQASAQALDAILGELQRNRAAVAASIDYHSGLLEMLRADHDAGWTPEPRQFSRGFVAPARLARTAWDSASETGILSKTDYGVVVQLSAAYSQQEVYEMQALSIGEIIYGELFRGGTQGVLRNYRNLAHIISTFAYREEQLLEVFDTTIASLDSREG